MAYLGTGVIALAVLLVLGRAFVDADPRALVRAVRYSVGIVLIGVGVLLAFAERWGVGFLLVALGISAISTGRIGPFDLGGRMRTPGSTSTVRSVWFEMSLDHDTGAMRGRVLAGSCAGHWLDDLNDRTVLGLFDEIDDDRQSVALLEAYLDRRMAGWRDHVEGDAAAGPRGTPDTGPMTDEEAYEILGLAPGAGEAEIRAAHRRLMMRVHPDKGGSTFLAAKINQAKDWLLGKHR